MPVLPAFLFTCGTQTHTEKEVQAMRDLQEVQRELEDQLLHEASQVYRSHQLGQTGKRTESTLPPGLRVIRDSIAPYTAALKAELDNGRIGKAKGGVRLIQDREWHKKHGGQTNLDTVAYLAVRALLDYASREEQLTNAAFMLGEMIQDEVQRERLASLHPAKWKRLSDHQNEGPYYRRVNKLQEVCVKEGIDLVVWDNKDKVSVGLLLIRVAIEALGWCLIEMRTVSKRKRTNFLVPTPQLLDWLERHHQICELYSFGRAPLVIPPSSWTSPWDGGYHFACRGRRALLSTRHADHLAEMAARWDQVTPAVTAINHLQAVAWTVNCQILGLMEEAYATQDPTVYALPCKEHLPLPEKPDKNDAAAMRAWKYQARKIGKADASRRGKTIGFLGTVSMGHRFAEYDQIYYAWVLDWRGRAYPEGSYLNPQGGDYARALLQFAAPKRMTKGGARWLAIHGATTYGEVDKEDYDTRVQWVEDHREDILDAASDPLRFNQWWTKADKGDAAWQFLRFCIEWAGWLEHGEDYQTTLPCSVDGSCNGLQNLCAMVLDEVGGSTVNLIPGPKPTDIYSLVAQDAVQVAQEKARACPYTLDQLFQMADKYRTMYGKTETNDELRRKMSEINNQLGALIVAERGLVTRKLVKRPTMTYAYSVTQYGMRKQIQEVLEEGVDAGHLNLNDDEVHAVANFLRDVVYDSIKARVIGAASTMDWLQRVAAVAAQNDLPIYWTAPDGLILSQAYYKQDSITMDSMFGKTRVRLSIRDGSTTRMDRVKMKSGVAPNYTHSMDAAHMRMTVRAMHDQGVTDLAMIHDSYATHCTDVPALNRTLREQFIRVYEQDRLAMFRVEVMSQLPEEVRGEVPAQLRRGGLNIREVQESEYFFS